MNGSEAVDAARLSLLLTELRLPAIKQLWPAFAERADKEGWPAARTLAALAEHEVAERGRRRIERHLAEARLPPGKSLDSFDFDAVPMVSKAQVMALVAGDSWLEKGDNLLVFGPPGGGKSHLAGAIGLGLVENGWRVLFTRTTDLVQRLQVARRELALEPGDRVGLYVGRLDQRHPKNCPWLLDLAAAWGERRQGLKLLLAGEGPDFGELQSRIDREGLSRRVHLLGHREPLSVYRAADLLLLPSGREGFSLVCAEAMCTGLPILRTRTAGTAETVVEGITGRSVDIDRQAFIRAALEMLGDPALLESMRPAAAAHVRQHLPFTHQLDQTQTLYQHLTTGKVPP